MSGLAIALGVLLCHISRGLDLTAGGDAYLIGTASAVSLGPLNPGNRVLRHSDRSLSLDLRPELRSGLTPQLFALLRPRAILNTERITVGGSPETSHQQEFRFDEASLRFDPTAGLRLVAGVHYYSWGPAELLSPSNPIFHFQRKSRWIGYRQRGQVLLRATWEPSSQTSTTLLFEPVSTGETSRLATTPYRPRGLARFEYSNASFDKAASLVAGSADGGVGFVGWTAFAYLARQFSLYVDARHTFEDMIGSLAITGIRLEGYFDSRIEYVYNSITSSTTGSEDQLLGRRYLFASLRTVRIAEQHELQLGFRYLHNLTDHSGAVYLSAELPLSASWTALLEPSFVHGPPSSELIQAYDWEIGAALRFAI